MGVSCAQRDAGITHCNKLPSIYHKVYIALAYNYTVSNAQSNNDTKHYNEQNILTGISRLLKADYTALIQIATITN
jgi:hypothetical protein